MQRADYLICGDYVLTMDAQLETIRYGAVAVCGNTVIKTGRADDLMRTYPEAKVIPGLDRVVLPGLINTHSHAAMVYFRGLADDLPLREWLEKHIWPAETRWLTPEFVSDATELACIEMLRAGITTFNDMYFFGDSSAGVSKTLGMRAVIGAGVIDFPSIVATTLEGYLANAERFIGIWKGDDLITPCVAPHAAHTCGPETLKRVRALAERLDVRLHTHLSETRWEVDEIMSRHGKRPVEYLDSIGFLDENLVAAHCVHLTDAEIELLAKRSVSVSHCIESNMKLASGIAPVSKMIKAGITVALGTDGAASNNDLNILSEMATAAKVHKVFNNDPTAADSKTSLLMATRWGAKALGLADRTGSLENGKLADIITLRLDKPHAHPLNDIYSHLTYSALASDVDIVMVNGRLLLQNGSYLNADQSAILEKAASWQKKISSDNQ